MPESPLSSSPYEVLGVPSTATHDELKRAFRRAMRETHPDVGGDQARFVAVQLAWERVGTERARAAFDARRQDPEVHETFTAQPARARQDSRPRTRAYGHPGGWRRERYLEHLREWVGRGVEVDDPYDPALVRSAPRGIRHILADALAEERTARTLADLGIGFTVWHDVATGHPEDKLDHVVLGPTGLWAILSEDFGGAVRIRRGELIGEAVDGARPMHDLAARAKALSRQLRVKFTGLVIVLPDDALDEPIAELGSVRGARAVAVRASVLAHLLRGADRGGRDAFGGTELFDVRTRLQSGIRFV